jgi:hypothetical protein
MKPITLATLLLLWPMQDFSRAEQEESPGPRIVTVLAGSGNSMVFFGLQFDYYFRQERFSLFGGTGYTPVFDTDSSSMAFAVGVRAFLGGKKHRALFEGSVSTVGIEKWTQGDEVVLARTRYGPGAQVGYQYTARGGLTFMITGGVGYALGLDPQDPLSPWVPLAALGVGYTWR